MVAYVSEQEHSKHFCDKCFGTATQTWAYRTQITLEDLGFQLLTRPRHEPPERKYRVYYYKGDSGTNWKTMFQPGYRCVPTFERHW